MFNIDDIYLGFEASSKEDLFEKMSKIFKEKDYIKDGYLESLLEREKNYSTGLSFDGYSIAIPHTYYEYVKEEHIAVVVLKNPVKFIEMGTEDTAIDVKVVLMLLVNKGEKQAEILSYLMQKVSNKEVYEILSSSNDKNEIYKILKK